MLASYSYIAAFISLLSFKKREKKVREKEKGKKKRAKISYGGVNLEPQTFRLGDSVYWAMIFGE